ncbi:hypothetical protein GCM10022219_12500 [Microbacterium oryzae]|uniref:DUF4287 domain-containing protein n=1 Tax=Microbacterium oryzae TaxID=743009 RepID=A0A6I6DZZ8_9MICO|nr:hypothetical protein [Microbacterium oryzae]QGU28393.1 hypothetical protein D7D94_12465 [Microbacterium oryzae]
MDSGWVAQPSVDDAAVTTATGRGWPEWVERIDAGPGPDAGHTAIARWLVDDENVDPWWAQAVTVGYERIRGLRLPGQMPDGTFSVSRSRTILVQAETFRAALLDDDLRRDLLPGLETRLVSKPETKRLRFRVMYDGKSAGDVVFAAEVAGETTKLTVTHEKLPTIDEAEWWKAHWASWLDGVGPSR